LKLSLPFTKKILSLDIGAYGIKVVEGRRKGQSIRIDKYFIIPTPEGVYDDGKIADRDLLHYTIHEELKKNKIRAKDVYLTINNSSIITREVTIPKVKDDEIERVLRFQLEDYIPIDPNNYIIQFKIIEEFIDGDVNRLNILLVAIPRDMVEEHFELLKSLSLNPMVLDYQPNSIAKLIQYGGLINGEYSTKDMTFAVIDMGYDSAKVSIIRNGRIQVSRIIEGGGGSIGPNVAKQDIIDNFFGILSQRIELVFRYFLSRKPGNRIDKILLVGGNSIVDGIVELFMADFSIPTMRMESLDNIYGVEQIYIYINAIGSIIRVIEV